MVDMDVDVAVINGPNLNLLGTREPETYGAQTLADIENQIQQKAHKLQLTCECFQSNAEHDIINHIHRCGSRQVKYIIINPAAFTHTSVAIRDALLGVDIAFVEVHLSNVHAREAFRHHSYFSDKAEAVICGCGALGYSMALDLISHLLNQSNNKSLS